MYAIRMRTADMTILEMSRLTLALKTRSVRMHILRQIFSTHDKTTLILQNYTDSDFVGYNAATNPH